MTKVRCSLLILVLLPAISIAKEQVRDATICEINSHRENMQGRWFGFAAGWFREWKRSSLLWMIAVST